MATPTTKSTTTRKTATTKVVTPLDIEMMKLRLAEKIVNLPEEESAIKVVAQQLIDSADLATKEAQIKHDSKVAQLEEEYVKKMEELADLLIKKEDAWNESKVELEEELENLGKQIEEKKATNAKALEELSYQHSLNIRNADYSVAVAIAKNQGKVLVDKNEWENTSKASIVNKEELEALVAKVKEAEGARNGVSSKYSALKAEFEQYKAVSVVKLEALTADNTTKNARIAELEAENKNIPKYIAEALDKAKSDINVTNETRK